MIYGFIDKSELDVILRTWSKIEIPPKPSKNAQIITLTDIALNGIFEIIATPFVSSIIPENTPFAKLLGKLIVFNKGEASKPKKSNILELLKMEIITLNSMTNPPIIKIVLIELIILFCNIEPKLLKLVIVLVFKWFVSFKFRLEELFFLNFQNLKIIPTVKQASICVKNNIRPIVVLPKRDIPTVPIIKSGPELFVNVIKRSPSSFVQSPFFLKFVTILAPTGYPTNNSHN